MEEKVRGDGDLPVCPDVGGRRVLVVVVSEAVELLFAEEVVVEEGAWEDGVRGSFGERVDGSELEAEACENGF